MSSQQQGKPRKPQKKNKEELTTTLTKYRCARTQVLSEIKQCNRISVSYNCTRAKYEGTGSTDDIPLMSEEDIEELDKRYMNALKIVKPIFQEIEKLEKELAKFNK